MRPLLAAVGVVAFASAAAFASRAAPVIVPSLAPLPPIVTATADPRSTGRIDAAAARASAAIDDGVASRARRITGLRLPIDGADLSHEADLLPEAPREYRAGRHEGLDLPADRGTPVRAVASGVVVRVDREFADWDETARSAALAVALALGYTPEATLDRIRGRQVWIDHGQGIVSRYAHLDAVGDVVVGETVDAGRIVGTVGSSGLPEGGPHLHLEIRQGGSYLGEALEGDALRRAIEHAFAAR